MSLSRQPELLTQNRKHVVEEDTALLQQAVERLVRFGRQVVVSAEGMISVLDSGLSVRDLLAFLASKAAGET